MSETTKKLVRRREVSQSINQYGVFPVTVSGVRRLSEHFVRVSLTGRSLHHAASAISDGTGQVYDAYIKLLVPPAHASGPTMIELDDTWRQRWMAQPVEDRGHMRTYTVQNSRMVPAVGMDETPLLGMFPAAEADLSVLERPLPIGVQPEIDIDFVLHQDDTGQLGPAAAWAASAQVGQQVSFLAPLRGSGLWSSWNPAPSHNLLMLTDETAAPATLSILRTLPAHASGTVLCEVPGQGDNLAVLSDVQEVTRRLPQLTVKFLPREPNSERGERLTHELHSVFNLPETETYHYTDTTAADEVVWGLAEENAETYVFIAGESSVIKTLRRMCVNEAGIAKENISFMGYWKCGRAES